MTVNILRYYRAANPEARAAGEAWYDASFTECERLSWLYSSWIADRAVTRTVVACAALSPRLRWSDNLDVLEALLSSRGSGSARPPIGVLERSWWLASVALVLPDPWTVFSKRANKTRSFAQAILGNTDAVVVDSWGARMVGLSQRSIELTRGYNQVADAFRRAAQIEGVTPRELQAVSWVHARGSHL